MTIINLISSIINLTVNRRRDISKSYDRLILLALVLCVQEVYIMILIIGDDIGLQGGLISITNTAQVFYVLLFVISTLMLQLPSFYEKDQFKIIEFSCIILFIIVGAICIISAKDFVSIFLSIELQSFSLYILSSISKDSEQSIIGALIYFLLGSLSSCFVALSIAVFYSNYGSICFEPIQLINIILDLIKGSVWYGALFLNISLLISSIGLLSKLGAAPFHFWSPDVYDSVPTIVTTFISILPKISIFLLLWGLIYYLNYNFTSSEINVIFNLILSSCLSLIIGTIVGLTQFRIKRLLTYSTISHVGFLLLCLSISSTESIRGFFFYLTQYTMSNLNSFIILLVIGYYYIPSSFEYLIIKLSDFVESDLHKFNDIINILYRSYILNTIKYNKTIINIMSTYYEVLRTTMQSIKKGTEILQDTINSPVQLISQLRGYFHISPFAALSFGLTIFSFAGIPPFIGFFGKQLVLNAALNKGFFFLAIIIVMTSIIGAFYYLKLIEIMFFYLDTLACNVVNAYNVTCASYVHNIPPVIAKIADKVGSMSLPKSYTMTIASIVSLSVVIIKDQEWLRFSTILAFYRL